MTEIVKNNSNMTFDLLETGNGGTNSPGAKGIFNALFGGIGTETNADTKKTDTNVDVNDDADMNIHAILNMLTESDLKLSDDILEEINNRLKKLFEEINIDGDTPAKINSEDINSLSNKNYVHIMTFLEDLESLIKLEVSGKDINSQLDQILNQIRIKLNEQVKATIKKKVSSQDRSKMDSKIVLQNQKRDVEKKQADLHAKDTSGLIAKKPPEADSLKVKSLNLDAFDKKATKIETSKILSSKAENLNISQSPEKKSRAFQRNKKKGLRN